MLIVLAVGMPALSASAQAVFTERSATIPGFTGASYSSYSASLADIDRDGDLDVFFQGAGSGSSTARQLLRNDFVGSGNGVLGFTNRTSASGITSGLGESWSAAWGDYNGDGYVDVFVGQNNSGGSLSGDVLRNNGNGTFTNASATTGLNDSAFHQNVGWVDIDRDLDLDLLIGMETRKQHEIYQHNPNGTFTPVGASAMFQEGLGMKSYGMAIGDTDGDGDLDVYISTCISGGGLENNFYENQLVQTGVLKFNDIADTNGTQNLANSYHSEFIDFDDDGDLDLFMVGADQEPTRIFRNNGGNQFTDVATVIGGPLISDVGGDLNGGRAVDYDNDGDLDLFMHDHLAIGGSFPQPSNKGRKLYRNDGNWHFVDVTVDAGLHTVTQGAYDSTWGDLDRDGDLDLVAPTGSGLNENIFISNAATNGNHWLYLRLEGVGQNTTAIGASVYATIFEGTPQERTLRREANTNAGTFNQSDLPVHFGLGQATVVDTLRIVWPDGTTQIMYDVAVDQYLDQAKAIWFPLDFNKDRKVDDAELAAWRSNFGMIAGSGADGDGDGDSDGADFLAWQRSFGMGPSSTPAFSAVPEPAAVLLWASALVGLLARTRRRRVV